MTVSAAHWIDRAVTAPSPHHPYFGAVLFLASLVHYALLHVGLLLALWKWKARWLLLEAAMLAAVVAVACICAAELFKFLD